MSENPFEPPRANLGEAAKQPATVVDSHSKQANRPFGIVVLAILSLLLGVFIGLLPNRFVQDPSKMPAGYLPFQASPLVAMLAMLGVGTLVFVAGIGLLRGRKWGWGMAGVGCVYLAASNAYTLRDAIVIGLAFPEVFGIAANYFVRFAAAFCLTIYLFRRHVMAYFGLRTTSRINLAILVVALGLCLFLIKALPMIMYRLS